MAEFLLRALSGAQINESEYGRLRALIPDPRSHISKFEADLNLFEQELQSTIDKRFGATGAEVPIDEGMPGGWPPDPPRGGGAGASPCPPGQKLQRNTRTGATRCL